MVTELATVRGGSTVLTKPTLLPWPKIGPVIATISGRRRDATVRAIRPSSLPTMRLMRRQLGQPAGETDRKVLGADPLTLLDHRYAARCRSVTNLF
jgi:hypothetical protein